jgi:hypothetical protein
MPCAGFINGQMVAEHGDYWVGSKCLSGSPSPDLAPSRIFRPKLFLETLLVCGSPPQD